MDRKKILPLGLLIAFFGFFQMAQAALLGVSPDFPRIIYNSTGTLVFDSGTTNLDGDAEALSMKFLATDPNDFPIGAGVVDIRIQVNGACGAAAGNAGGGLDLEVIGDIYDPISFALIKSGVLLTGDIVAMGSASATGTTSAFDFRFTNAGGLLVTDGDWPAGKDIGILLTSENSNFADDCVVNFSGGAKGTIGPIDPLMPPNGSPGTGTLGYWMNHLDLWMLDPITVGGVVYTAAEANNLLRRPPKGDKTWSMFRQLTAAMLNVANGTDASCIQDTIDAANQWLIDNPLGSGVSAGSAAWKDVGDALHETLDAYNNGELCAPHRDN